MKVVLKLMLLLGMVQVFSQTIPFGTNNSYSYGFMQNFEPNASADTRADSWYDNWIANFYTTDCGGGRARIRNGSGSSNTYSEGQGYGMLLTAYAGDQTRFAALWSFYQNKMNANGLMHWDVTCGGVSGSNGATDGDLDAAMALLIAHKQWPSAGYGAAASTLIANIRRFETNGPGSGLSTCSTPQGNVYVTRPGDAFNTLGSCNCINISYFSPAYYRAFAVHEPTHAAFWNQLADDCYKIIDMNDNNTTGLVSAWTRADGSIPSNAGGNPDYCNYAVSGGGLPSDYQYDACRTPMRIVMDYLWWGSAGADAWLTRITNWAQTQGIANIRDGYRNNGTLYGSFRNSAFTGSFAVGMAANSQSLTDSWYNGWVTKSSKSGYGGSDRLDDDPYFQNTLATIQIFIASGNFWNPFNGSCVTPSLGNDLSTCSGTTLPVTLNSNTTKPTNVTFTWYKNGTVISGQTNQTCPSCADVVGTYVVVRDSSGGCSKRDTIIIASTLPTPALGSDITLCNPAMVNIAPSNLASFPVGTTWQWSVDFTGGTSYSNIAGATSSSYPNVRRAGRYRLRADAGSCTSLDDVVITSNLPTPLDGCVASGPASVALGITNPGLNGTNYDWYANATGGSPLSGGSGTTSFNTPSISSTTTYYVQDASSVNGNVGPSTLFGQGLQYGCSNERGTVFTATSNFTLKALKIPFQFYGTGLGGVTIEILNSSNTVVAEFTSDNMNAPGASGGTASLFRFTFNGGAGVLIDRTTWGSPLKMRIKQNTCTINGNPHWNDVSVSGYPFNSPGNIVSITGFQLNNDPVETNKYAYFYDWEISTGNTCARLPVIATVGGGCAPAPVELSGFHAVSNQNHVYLHWSTASESDNDYFILQRSLNGYDFRDLARVEGYGNSTSLKQYDFRDYEAPFGLVYYRLVQVDVDNTRHTSEMISVVRDENLAVQAAPNPFEKNIGIMVRTDRESAALQVQVFDVAGNLMSSEPAQANELFYLGDSLPSGVYVVQISLDSRVEHVRIIKQ
ncbi:MAG: glycosyl hydrolase family 8 [Cytophagaceae bacterium]|jgi:endo-1,4-beta-D-glucanase Y|nr:glycosyl hydrolase family 8 [Cytophagaceae bacterium]